LKDRKSRGKQPRSSIKVSKYNVSVNRRYRLFSTNNQKYYIIILKFGL